ncbi:hypothetical protein ASC77_19330 [Nocardioides sp. Root1257]|uniref:sensor domain-containing protein n=1 Tax=unclassified Nocardioides TaxID=2615069 RepID=UPI0006FED0A3|nr:MULTISPECIES: EAL domain-containing protein [unclassified Nocardioides]KQW46050.1 hypothetical protein ASC77_19330 [Nocardioides sp. Root1257]KRC43313.1 hypothetical protein ASE24_20295 [Nocardioides sp. Root224]
MRAPDPSAATSTPPSSDSGVVETDVPAACVDIDGRFTEVNSGLCRLVGLSTDELVGTHLNALADYPTDVRRGRRALVSAAAGTPCGGFTQHWTLEDRTSRRVRLVWTLNRDAHGAPASLNVFCLDEARPSAGERFWEALLTESADITWTADADGVLTTATAGVEHQTGLSAAELVGTPLLDLAHPDDQDVLREAWDRLLRGTGREVVEYRLTHPAHGWRLVRQVLTDHRGNPDVRAVVGNAVDVHELRRLEAALGEATTLGRAQFQLSPVPQVQWDARGRVTDVNTAFCELVGWSAASLVGRPTEDLLHSSAPGYGGAFDGLLPLDGAGVADQVLTGPDGQPVPVAVTGTVLYDEDGNQTGVFASVQDVSGVRRLARRRERQESFFLSLAQRAGDLSMVTDATGLVLYISPALTDLVDWRVEDLIELAGTDRVHADDKQAALDAFDRVVEASITETVALRIRGVDDRWRWTEATATNLLDTAVGGVLWNLRDIDDRVRAEAALRASEARYRAIADNAEEGLAVFGPDGRMVYANHRLLEILGAEAGALPRLSLHELLPPMHVVGLDGPASSERHPERYEVDYRHPDGRRRTLRVSAAPLDDIGGNVEGSLAMISDVTDARLLEQQLRRAALHDTLTGLPNRALLFDRLEHALVRGADATAVLFVDLDLFKSVNDGWGHAVGDELLVLVAGRLVAAARPGDTVGRFAGDQFLVVCEDVDEAAARQLAADLLTALDGPYDVSEGQVPLTVSIGVATSPTPSAEELVHRTDAAMHAAKAAGRHRVRFFDASLADTDDHHLGADLRRALERDELRLHHQPVVDLGTGRVLGTEALARWHHPVHGDVAPSRFVALAEHLGLVPELDRWALRRALADARSLREDGAMAPSAYVAVNMSVYTLGDPDVDSWIADAVEAAGFAPTEVLLEVTESAIMADAPTAVGVLTRLRERGFAIAVDDFGTGHSSLAYLHHLPVTVLKIDRSFVTDVVSDPSALAIAASIVELARAVGLSVVAEGVETQEQADLLRGLGCDAAQGWLWSRAVSPDEARTTGALTSGY